MQEGVPTQSSTPKDSELKMRIVAGVVVGLLAVGIIIAIVPSWRSALLDTFFMTKQERLLKSVNALAERIPEGEYPTEDELLQAVAELNTQTLTAEEAQRALEELDAISR